jgi:hypothetical protein
LVADDRLAATGCDDLKDELGKRFGQHDRFLSQS